MRIPAPSNESLLSRVNWRQLAGVASREVKQRQLHSPVVSAYRWWARRPHCVMGAILDAAVEQYGPGLTAADPFSGGGTVTFEAAKRGLKAYAQDLYPWPARGLASALHSCDADDLTKAAAAVLEAVAHLRLAYKNSAGQELSHILRVRTAECLDCGRTSYQFPHPLVSRASRAVAETSAFFGCYECGSVSKRNKDVGSYKCGSCASRWSATTLLVGCAHCASERLSPTGWHAVLVQQLTQQGNQWRAVLRPVKHDDPVQADSAVGGVAALNELISPGKETKRLIDNGLMRWGDLYTRRQAHVLAEALVAIKQLDMPLAVKDRLAFSVLGAAEMPAFLSRWDRSNLKPFEGMANHRYTQTTLAVETNFLSPVGRGTLPRRFGAASTSLQWLIESCSTPPKVVSTTSGRRGRKRTDWDILISTGSSSQQALRDGSVSVVVTDPPYFDDVQYGELARLFHAWLKVYDPKLTFDEAQEAVPNSIKGTSAADYENIIAACLRESRRTLKEDGTLVLTFHNKKMVAWQALTGAICKAGFVVKALAVVRAENEADHCKRNVEAMLHDLVIECVPSTSQAARPVSLEFRPKTLAEMNLVAIGLALAECVKSAQIDRLAELYVLHLSRLTKSDKLIR